MEKVEQDLVPMQFIYYVINFMGQMVMMNFWVVVKESLIGLVVVVVVLMLISKVYYSNS
jgi:hypothetical protein